MMNHKAKLQKTRPGYRPDIALIPVREGNYAGCIKILIILIFGAFATGACSNLRYIDEGKSLYTGSRLEIVADETIPDLREIETEAESVIRPRPNSRFLFWRPRLWVYNVTSSFRERSIGGWLKKNLGRAPVLFDHVDPERTTNLIQNRLFNMGYFDAGVNYNLTEKSKRTSVTYQISVRQPYTIGNFAFTYDNDGISRDINLAMKESILERGQIYSLNRLKKERERIDAFLKELGYFYFHPDYLLFRADSTVGIRVTDLYMTIKPASPVEALEKYRTGNVFVDIGHTQGAHRETENDEAGETKGELIIRQDDNFIKTRTIERSVFLIPDSTYRYSDHRLTINHLMGLEVFKFVNISFEQAPNDTANYIDAIIRLTPMEKRNISSEIQWVSKSNSFTGPGLTGSLVNRNLFGGAENLTVNIEGAFESMLGQSGVTSTEAGITSELNVPRLITPFKFKGNSGRFIPRSTVAISFNHRNRTDAFSLSSFRSRFGYRWNPSRTIQHRLNPFVFNIFRLGNLSEEYNRIFSEEELLRRGLFEQFLIGGDYSFIFNSQLAEQRRHDWYFNLNVDLSGNLAWFASNYLYRGLNWDYSQYSKADIDFRHYLDTGNRSRIATRIAAGAGYPYGNSETLPYTRLFTVGGTNSIRAFHPRSLGPGSYASPDTITSTLNIYQSGEVKLEMSIEYRFDLGSIFKAAIFADAGNIWNLREKENVPGGMFKKDEFMRQIALGTGAGLRMDFTFFLLRMDLAFPVANPSTGTKYFEKIRPLDRSWRRENLLLNLAIGYPF